MPIAFSPEIVYNIITKGKGKSRTPERVLTMRKINIYIPAALIAILGIIACIVDIVIYASAPKNTAQTPCPLCAEACEIFHTTRVESEHREAPNYYYYTYKCKACGNEFTLEIVQE